MPWAFGYANPRAIHWGPGALAQLEPELKRLQMNRVRGNCRSAMSAAIGSGR